MSSRPIVRLFRVLESVHDPHQALALATPAARICPSLTHFPIKKQMDMISTGHNSPRRNLHSGAVQLQDTVSDNSGIPASPSVHPAVSAKSSTSSSTADSISGGGPSHLDSQVDQPQAAVPEAGNLQSSLQGAPRNQDRLEQVAGAGPLAVMDTTSPIHPGTPPSEASAPSGSPVTATAADTTAAAVLNRPLPGHETAHSFLRDANLIQEHYQSKSASRITAVIRRLGSVPTQQIKANADTARNTVIDLISLAVSEPRVDAAMFLMAYSKSVVRHPRLLSALKHDSRYNRAIEAIIFDPLHGTAPLSHSTESGSSDGPRAPEMAVGIGHGDEGARAGRIGAEGAGLTCVWEPQQPQPPRIFRNPSTFAQALSALVRLYHCPPAFWQAIVTWGVPTMYASEQPAQGVPNPGGSLQHGMHTAVAAGAPHAVQPARRPDWMRKNASTAITVTEMLGLRYTTPAPAEGLDARPVVRRPRWLPALAPPAAVHEVEAYIAGVVDQLAGEEVAKVLYNIGQAQLRPQSDVLCVLEERALKHAAEMSGKSISMLLGGYVGMRVRPGPLLEEVLTRRLSTVAIGVNIHPLSVVLLQSAKLGATLPEPTFAALVTRMHGLVKGAAYDTTKFAPRLLWTCAVYTAVHGAAVARQADLAAASWTLVRAFAELWEAGRLGCERDGTTILRQAHRSMEVLGREHGWTIEEGTAVARFAQHCRRVAQEYATRQADTAQMHGMRLKIFQQVQRICDDSCTVSQKVLWGDGAHFSYIIVDTGKKWISVELEVAANVVSSVAGDVTGITAKPLLRNWALQRWGGAALSIVEEEWDEVSVLSESFAECLRAELRARGAAV